LILKIQYFTIIDSIYQIIYRVGDKMGKKHASARVKNRIKQQVARAISILEKKFSHGGHASSGHDRFKKK
jgi:hypothetical protein